MFRFYDWECTACGDEREDLVDVPYGGTVPELAELECDTCKAAQQHTRLISIPAEYHGERTMNLVVHGGYMDTAGQKPLPALPDVKPQHANDPAAWRDLFASPEWKDTKKQRNEIKKQNKMKKKRLEILRSGGNINMRRDKLPGDPKSLTA